MSRIQRDAPSAFAGRTRACLPSGAPASDFSMLLVPGTVAAPAAASTQARAESEANPTSVPEHSTPGSRPLPPPLAPEVPLEAPQQTVTPHLTSAPPSRMALRQSELHDDTVVPTHHWLPPMTGEGQDQVALALPPGMPNHCAPTGDSDQASLPHPPLPLPSPLPLPHTISVGPADRVPPSLGGPLVSEFAAGIDHPALESAPADPERQTARSTRSPIEGAQAVPGAGHPVNQMQGVNGQSERDGVLSKAIENLPAPVRSWNGDGDRLFDLTAWARGLLSYARADHALGTPAEPAAAPTRGPLEAAGPGHSVLTGMAISPAASRTEAQHRAPRVLTSETAPRRAVDAETRSSARDAPSASEVAELAPPRQVLLVVREDSAVLYVRDYFAQPAGLELVVEQVRKLLLTRNRAGLRVVINGHWQSTEQIRRGSDGN